MTNDNLIDFNEFVKSDNEDDVKIDPIKSYKIPRNEPCPCGSGKKYKKCCAKVTPNKPLSYYLDKLGPLFDDFENTNNTDLKKYYKIIQQAERDYPVEPIVLQMAGLISYQLDHIKQSVQYLTKYYKIVKSDIEIEFLYYLIDGLNKLSKFKKSEKFLEEFIGKYDDFDLYLLMTEIKLALGKTKQGYKYGLTSYKKANNDVSVLNLILNLFLENNVYQRSIPLITKNYDKLLKSNKETEAIFSFVDSLIEIVFLTEDPNTINNSQKKKYLNKIVDIIKITSPFENSNHKVTNKLRAIISDDYDLAFLLNRLYYFLEKYEWVVNNEDFLMNITEHKDILFDSLIDANFQLENYKYIVDNLSDVYEFNFLHSSDPFIVYEYTKYYLVSLHKSKDHKKIKKLLSFLNTNLQDNTLDYILLALDNKNYLDTLDLLKYLKTVNKNNLINEERLLELIIALFDRNIMKFMDKNILAEKEKSTLRKYLDEYSSYNNSSFVYHFTNWLLNKTESNNQMSLTKLINEECNHLFSEELKYLVILKYLDPKIIINNSLDTEFLHEKDLNFYKSIAKFINGDIKNLQQLLTIYPQYYQRINSILNDILTDSEKETLYKNF